jgi:zinc protease
LTAPVVKEIYGPDAEWVNIGFRFNGRNSDDYKLLTLTDMILANSQAGLIDLNLKQAQKVLDPGSYIDDRNDYSVHTFTGKPREGQTLEQVKDLLLEQIELVKKGEFEDWLIEATINDLKKMKLMGSEQNWSRSNDLVMAFTNDIPWDQYIREIDDLRKFTKEDIVKFANANYGNNYVVVYKRTGKDPNTKKVTKPAITKVALNKENKSAFHENLAKNKVEKLKPVFLDYNRDLQKLKMNKGVEVLYTPNKENELFSLYYLSDVGRNNDPKLNLAIEYLQYLGTEDMPADEVKKELYRLGCSFNVSSTEDQTYISLNGLSPNMEKAVQLFEKVLANPKEDEKALEKMIDGIFKEREDTKKNKFTILYEGLLNYGLYGPNSPFTNVLSNKELRELKASELIDILKGFTKTQHRVLYYGPMKEDELIALLNRNHNLPEQLQPAPALVEFPMAEVSSPQVFWTHYDMVQAEAVYTMKGPVYTKDLAPYSRVYNEYMSTQVFQELREAQGLAYSTWTSYQTARKQGMNDFFFGYIGTQADKQEESLAALKDIITNMPETEDGFRTAKEGVLNQLESERIRKASILFNYLNAQRHGLDYDVRKDVYEKAQTMSLADIKKFQEENIRNGKFNTVIIANRNKINLNDLKKYGKVKELTLDEIFGYEKVQKVDLEVAVDQ